MISKTSVLIASVLLCLSGCTKKIDNNNKHESPPTLIVPVKGPSGNNQVFNLGSDKVNDFGSLFKSFKSQLKGENIKDVFKVIEGLEKYVLDKKMLSDPNLNSNGYLDRGYKSLVDLYGYALSLALIEEKGKESSRIQNFLENYKNRVLEGCSNGRDNCRFSKAFRGPYGVYILSFIIGQDIKRLRKIDKKVSSVKMDLEIDKLINTLYIVKNFGESNSNQVEHLFIEFSDVFFSSVDLKDISIEDHKKYVSDFQNIFIKLSKESGDVSFCKILKKLDQKAIEETKIIQKDFIRNLKVYLYSCGSDVEIINKIKKLQAKEQSDFTDELNSKDPWLVAKNSSLYRRALLEKTKRGVLNNFSIIERIPDKILYLMEQIYYGFMKEEQYTALAKKFTEEELVKLIKYSLQYSQENFLYMTHYTFSSFNRAARLGYEKENAITSDFVQNVYDRLIAEASKPWEKFKQNNHRYVSGLGHIFSLLSREKKNEVKDIYDEVKEKLSQQEINRVINHGVTFPIRLMTKYFIKQSGHSVINLKFNWSGGVDNSLTISVERPFANYFLLDRLASDFKILKFGYLGYDPTVYERKAAFSLAIKTGFFDVANFNLGGLNKGRRYNLSSLFGAYLEDNTYLISRAQDNFDKLKKIKDGPWKRIKNFCQKPLTSEYSLKINQIREGVHIIANDMSSSGTSDQGYIKKVYELRKKITDVSDELQRIKRMYQVIKAALPASVPENEELLKDLQKQVVPFMKVPADIYAFSQKILSEVDKEQACLTVLNKIEVFKRNILQKKTVTYLARVHSSMSFLEKFFEEVNPMGALELKNFIISKSESSDNYLNFVLKDIIRAELLSKIESQLSLKGGALLKKALNLSLSTHNFIGDFGYPISEMRLLTDKLNYDFLSNLGYFDRKHFKTHYFDHIMRMREELYSLKVPVRDLKRYFKDTPAVMAELKGLEDNFLMPLNQGINIAIPTYREIKENIHSKQNLKKILFTTDQKDFIQTSLEIIFGKNQNGNQFVAWSGNNNLSGNWFFKSQLSMYLGRNLVSLSPENKTEDPACFLDHPFGEYGQGCVGHEVTPESVVDAFIVASDFDFNDREELFPLVLGEEGSQEDELVDQTLLSSNYIPHYDKDNILGSFQYHKYSEEPRRWTWFDKFIAKNFTTTKLRNSSHKELNVSVLPGASEYKKFFTQVVNSRMDSMILSVDVSVHQVIRAYYRHIIIKSLNRLDAVFEVIVKKEQTFLEDDLPLVSLREEDLPLLRSESGRNWFKIPTERRMGGPRAGSLLLLGDEDYELAQLKSYKRQLFAKYNCDLLPQNGDSDFDSSLENTLEQEGRGCAQRVKSWMQSRSCSIEKKRAQLYENYAANCK